MPPYLHLATSEMWLWPGGRTILAENCLWATVLCTIMMVHKSHGVQLPARSSTSVPRGIVPISRRCRITATSPIRHPTAPGRTVSSALLPWPTGFLCGWSGLEYPARLLAESDYWREQFQSLKTFLFAPYWCIQHIRGFTTMRYINRLFAYLLTSSSYMSVDCIRLWPYFYHFRVDKWVVLVSCN